METFKVAVVDVEHILRASSIQAVSGFLFQGKDAEYVAHKVLETFMCRKFERAG